MAYDSQPKIPEQRHHVAAGWGLTSPEGIKGIPDLIQRTNEVAYCNCRQPYVCNPSCLPKCLNISPEVVIILRITKALTVFGPFKHAFDGTNVRGSQD